MQYKAQFIDLNKTVDVLPNVKIIQKYNQELDMLEFTLSTLSEELDLDLVKYNGLIPIRLKMTNEATQKTEALKLYLTYYHKIVVAYNPKKYKYVIQATTPTIILQRITLPNKLITQPISDNKRSVYTELSKIMQVYAPGITLDPNLEERLSMPCPEMQFVKSTLHEVLIGLFAVANLVPKMDTFNQLTFIDLKGNNTNRWNSESIFIREEESNTLANYADMLDIDVENAISENEDIATTWIPTVADEARLTTENFYWKLPSEIYDIKKVELMGDGITFNVLDPPSSAEEKNLNGTAMNITKFVVSKEIYDTLQVSSALVQKSLDYKRNNIYYDKDTINGGAYNEKTWFGKGYFPAIHNIITLWLEELYAPVQKIVTNVEIADVRELMIRVTYKSDSDNTRIKVIKNNIKKPFNALISNQNDAYIDAKNFGKQQQETINRIGNKTIVGQANFKFKDNYTLRISPQVGQIVDDVYFISERECLLKENNMLVNYTLTKDYVNEIGYSGLKQLKRFTSIDTEGTVIRNDNFLYNFELSETKEGNDDYLINQFINKYGEEGLGMCLHYFESSDDFGRISHLLLLTSQNKHMADSIVCQMGFQHNYVAGNRTAYEDRKAVMKPVTYADENGEFKTASIYFGKAEEQRYEKNYDIVSNYPEARFEVGTIHDYTDLLIYKDNREISKFTFQFRLLGNDKIFVYNKFLDYTELTRHLSENLKVYFAYSEDEATLEKYNKNSVLPIGEVTTSARVLFGKDKEGNEQRSIMITNVLSSYGSYAIGVTDSHNNLLFAVNYHKVSFGYDITLWVNEI